MPEEFQPLAAVHYYYLLKNDDQDLQRLWSTLTTGADDLDAGQAFPSLGLISPAGETGDYCRVIHRARRAGSLFCLCMLPDMSLIEVNYPRLESGMESEWQRVMEAVESDRDRLLSAVSGVFGETTVLAAPTGTSAETMLKAAGATTERALATRLNPEAAGEEQAYLVHFPDLTDGGRDYYAIAAVDPQTFTATIFPEMDSLIKKLGRTARYFEQQRQTIVSERADVDREVGALLHRQVVTDTTGAIGAALLEDQIVSLSRMFGMLATDSLLVRRSSEGISRYIKQLNRELKVITAPGSSDEIGAHYINRFSLDLAETQDESHNLDFSRQNAQAAIEVVRTQVEIMRAGEEAAIQQQSQEILSRSLVLQKERLALQVAAGFVEFVLVFYYVLKS
ncbi:MAG: hypothetical protein AABZ63_00315, partial [Actinomycetota bacterium]